MTGASRDPVGRRLAVTLGLWILPAVMLTMAASLWMSATTITEMADSAYDRSLAGAIRAIDSNISTESGGVGVELPYNLFAFFELTAQGRVYFNVSTDDNLVQIGDVLLPAATGLELGEIKFEDVAYFGEIVRLGSLRRPLDASRPDGTAITIQVAEAKGSRSAFQNTLIERAIVRDVLVVLALGLMIATGVYYAVKPLRRLRDSIDRREPNDLTPIGGPKLPAEVQPLVDAINRLMQRNLEQAEQQNRFLDDASHQLRTPMAVLRTQIDVALHEADATKIHETLRSAKDVLDRSTRTTNQLLTLARARTSHGTEIFPTQTIDLAETAAETIRLLWPWLRSRKMDCALDAPEEPMLVRANGSLIREALTNLVDNAVNYATPRSLITVRLTRTGTQIVLEVEDSGPGMSDDEMAQAGTRFRRGSVGRVRSGSGLGLAIASTAAKASNGTMTLRRRKDRSGLVVAIALPAHTDS
jgi:two-component system sensor histidine kinase TctE